MELFSYYCESIITPTKDITLLTALPCDPQQILLFQAGQYIEASLKSGVRLSLSIANAPQPDGALVFHIRHNEKYPLAKQWLNETLQSGKLRIEGPKGTSILTRSRPNTSLIFLAGGTGFAPIRSILFSLLSNPYQTHPAIHLYWGVTRLEDAYEREQLALWKKQCSIFNYDIILSDRWLTDCIHDHQWENTTVFASGPYEMIQIVLPTLTTRGLKKEQFISDLA